MKHIGFALLLSLALTGCQSTDPSGRQGGTEVKPATTPTKKIVLIAGKPSHGPGDHEFRAGCLLLQKSLSGVSGINAVVYSNGWPSKVESGKTVDDNSVFEDAAAVLIYADGGGGHPLLQGDHLKVMTALMQKGIGLGCAHYGVEIPSTNGGSQLLDWIGGHYEHLYSVNPMWTPEFKSFPNHPVTRGVRPFALLDEWYFNMRWRPDLHGVTPILVATPTDKVRNGPYVYPQGPYKHVQEAKGRPETMMWVCERAEGGRGFGFTGGHKHVNWANDNDRKIVLNALLWIAKAEVPPNGVESSVAPHELAQNLDPKGVAADAPNLTGTWNLTVETANASGAPSFTFTHAGQNLIGQYKGRLGEAEVSGSVNHKNNEVKWSFEVDVQGEKRTCVYKGKVEGKDSMKGTVTLGEYEGTWTAKR
ncbi:MAG: ThuA domain-containing protein [Verrucomicrobiales bacterium]|nr:ThuA domain-containing protein [Verrucomicrobiales bacterium]